MGNGVSIKPGGRGESLFERVDLCRAAQKLSKNKDHQKLFASFLKDSIWLDKVGLLSCDQSSQYDLPPSAANYLLGYLLPPTLTEMDIEKMRKIPCAERFVASEGSEKTVTLPHGSPTQRRYQDSEKTVNRFKDSVSTATAGSDQSKLPTLPSTPCADDVQLMVRVSGPLFSKMQILEILISVAYPLFEESRISNEAGQERPRMCFMDREGQCCCAVRCVEPKLTSEAMQTQGMFLHAAAHYNKKRIVSVLSNTNWLHEVKRSFDEVALGVFICDAYINTNYPVLYANAALESMTGYENLIGKSFQKQYGPNTEAESIVYIQTALQSQQSARVVLTSYRQDGSTFVSTLALKPIFNKAGECCFYIGVMCDISSHTACLQDLQHVDTILALLPLIVAP